MNAQEALLEAVAAVPDPEEFAAFTSMVDEYEKLVGEEEYESTIGMAYRFFLAGRLFQQDMVEEGEGPINIQLTAPQAQALIRSLLGGRS